MIMKKGLIIATVLVALGFTITGGVILGVAISQGAFKGTTETVKKEYTITEAFDSININVDVSDITFNKSEDDKVLVKVEEKERLYHTVSVVDNALTIKTVDELNYWEKMWGYNNLKLTIDLPDDAYEHLKIKDSTGYVKFTSEFTFATVDTNLTTGSLHMKNINVDDYINSESSTGSLHFESVRCASIKAKTSTGSVHFNDFIASGSMEVSTSTGSVHFLNSDADTISVKTSTGSVKGNLLSDHLFHAYSHTGTIHFPSTTGPLCEISTSTGNIDITVGKV